MDNCLTCKFAPVKVGGYFMCHRFPQTVRVTRDYWCGEWRAEGAEERTNGTHQKSTRKRVSQDQGSQRVVSEATAAEPVALPGSDEQPKRAFGSDEARDVVPHLSVRAGDVRE